MSNAITNSVQRKTAWGFAAMSIAISALLLSVPMLASAASPELYVSPGSAAVTKGSTYTVDIRLNDNLPADAVETTLTYNTSFLKYVSVDSSSSAFPVELQTTTTNNSVSIVRGIFAPGVVAPHSNALIAHVTFQVLNREAVTTLKIAGNATYQGDYTNPTLTSQTVRIAN